MANAYKPELPTDANRRTVPDGRPLIAGVPVRDDDLVPRRGLHGVALLFRVLAGLLGVIIALQIVNGLTSTVEISYGVLIAEVIRLVIFAGLLWGAGVLADMFVKSHDDLRASRILLGRVVHQLSQRPGAAQPPAGSDADHGRGDATH